jgi:prepilin-type N-terminal cleavage/methylation domain-containing protein
VSRRRQPGQKGFTLIELLVVIAVLAILAAIVIFNIVGVTNKGSSSACATDQKSIQTAVDAYYNDHITATTGDHPYPTVGGAGGDVVQTDLVTQYLHTWPSEKVWNIAADGTVTTTCP